MNGDAEDHGDHGDHVKAKRWWDSLTPQEQAAATAWGGSGDVPHELHASLHKNGLVTTTADGTTVSPEVGTLFKMRHD